MPDEEVAVLRKAAQDAGTYHATCPSSLTGKVVFIQSGTCYYGNNLRFNTAAAPGTLVLERATLTLDGNSEFYGVVYARNDQGSSDFLVRTYGTATIFGAVFIDFGGGMLAGASGENLVYDTSVLTTWLGYGEGVVVRGSWRELPTTTVAVP